MVAAVQPEEWEANKNILMADAVLQHYDLGPAISANGFAEAVATAANIEARGKEQRLRAQEHQDAIDAQNSEYLSKQLSIDKYKGTPYDEENTKALGGILSKAQLMASQGKGMPEIQMAIGVDLTDFNAKYKQEKQMKDQIDSYLSKFKGVKGINTEALQAHAYGMAFHNTDPNTGQYTGTKDATTLDPNTNWVEEAIKAHPEDVSNGEGLADALAKTKRDKANPRGNIKVGQDEYKVGYDSELYPFQKFSDERNQYGNPKGVEVGGQVVKDGAGKPIADENGNPMKVVPDQVYNYYRNHAGVDPYLTGLAKKEFKNAGVDIKEGDPRWDIWKKHELYKYLNENAGVSYSPIAEKTSASQRIQMLQDPRYIDALESGARARSTGNLEGKIDMGVDVTKSDKKPATTVAGAVASVYQGNYEAPSVDYDGKKYEDITGAFPKGSLKFGKSDKNTYSKVLFDPATNKITTVYTDPTSLKDVTKTYDESQVGQFVGSHSEANGSTIATNRKVLGDFGFDGKMFKDHRQDGGTRLIRAEQEEKAKVVDDAIDSEDYSKLKKLSVPDGKVEKVGTISNWNVSEWGGNKYYVTLKSGEEKKFKTKEALANYLKGGSKPAEAPAAGKETIPGY